MSMPGQFSTINSALRGMQAQQKALQTTAHNIANASTPGFTRQQTVMAASTPFPMPGMNREAGPGQVGTGVDILMIRRIRDAFLDTQIRAESASLGQWEVRRDALQQVEVIFMEPSESGLNTILSQFWNSWQELSKNAESSPVRTTVRETSIALAEAIRHTYAQLNTVHSDLLRTAEIRVIQVNSIARQVADLNTQIANIQQSGHQPNDLKDQRDKLLDELARIIPFTTEEILDPQTGRETGAIRVILSATEQGSTGPRDLVYWREPAVLALQPDGIIHWQKLVSGEPPDPPPQLNVTNGAMKGLATARDLVTSYMKDLDVLARGLIDLVNQVHQDGIDLDGNSGHYFFTGTGAADMEVAPEIRGNVRKIAASTTGAAGDGANALNIVALKSTRLRVSADGSTLELAGPGVGGTTFDNFYKDFIARLGVATNESTRMADNQAALLAQLEQRKEMVSGVSLDEEMANMVLYQRAYQASARVIAVVDEMLEVIVTQLKR